MSTVQQQLDIPRDKVKQMGFETVEILKQGFYQTPNGKVIDIRKVVLKAVEGTVTYSPDKPLRSQRRGAGIRIQSPPVGTRNLLISSPCGAPRNAKRRGDGIQSQCIKY